MNIVYIYYIILYMICVIIYNLLYMCIITVEPKNCNFHRWNMSIKHSMTKSRIVEPEPSSPFCLVLPLEANPNLESLQMARQLQEPRHLSCGQVYQTKGASANERRVPQLNVDTPKHRPHLLSMCKNFNSRRRCEWDGAPISAQAIGLNRWRTSRHSETQQKTRLWIQTAMAQLVDVHPRGNI